MMKMTHEWLHQWKTGKGGWTRVQLAAIGVPWPPKKGWLSAAIGREITDEQRRRFEEGRRHASEKRPPRPLFLW